jgi:hypothetical protein
LPRNGFASSINLAGEPLPDADYQTWYQFSIAPFAAKTSELHLGVSLYEKDRMPTVGGGRSIQIYLAGFQPKMQRTGAKPE